jgi:hypothetical protein
MSLSDNEILELNELCNALVDGVITERQSERLSQWLSVSEDARQFYLRSMGLSASLISYASEMQSEAPDAAPPSRARVHLLYWILAPLAAAACVAAVVWFDRPEQPLVAVTESRPNEFVAQLTGSKECQWADDASSVRSGGRLLRGQRIELAKGFAEITFDSGAQVVLEGPASLDVKSAWEAGLHRGTLKATVPPQAIGFRISNPSVEVVDLGTEFTMSADDRGAAEVLVLKGQIEAQPGGAADRQPIVLRERESRRFAASGTSSLNDDEERLARLAQPIPLDRFTPTTDCAHWSFDETVGGVFKADGLGLPAGAADVQVKAASRTELSLAHSTGCRQGALRFDGHLYAKSSFPGIARYSPHTVAFWVKVPRDASLGNAYSMVAWGVNCKKLGSHPIQISWNRNPNEGPVGVLRTDYGGGFAIGDTPLRDGAWHHIAVVLLPKENAQHPLQVNLYVDGRLEGEGKPSPSGSDVFLQTAEGISNDVFWLGCRFGVSGIRAERFLGEMDELFIADRALEPREIVQLMTCNELLQSIATANHSEKTAVQQ